MKLSLCPRCELNYITENEKYCRICLQEMHSNGQTEEVELCSICNENPVMPGKDVCSICFQEINGGEDEMDETEQDSSVDTSEIGGMDSVSEMDEIIPDLEHDMNEPEFKKIESEEKEFGDIENPISLEEEQEREESDEDEEDEDNL